MKKFLIVFVFLFLPIYAHSLEVPKLQGYVNDYANMISPSARAQLENELRLFEQTDSTQIVILTVPSLEGDTIEDFGIRVGDAWKIGQKGKDNGVIFLAAKQERKIRIEVGRGLEGKLTDLMSGRIIDLVIKPRFKRGDFDGGFISGVSSLIDATRGEFKADENHRQEKQKGFSSLFTYLIFGGFILLTLGSISRILGAIAGAIGLPLIVYLTAAVSLGLVFVIILAIIGLAAGLLISMLFSVGGRSSGGGFFPGGGFRTTGGGSSSGGNFGGFSGGGASGSW